MTGIPLPGSMLKNPSKPSGLRLPAPIPKIGEPAVGKRKLADDNGSPAARPAASTGVPAAGRQIRMPTTYTDKADAGTVHAGRRSSQGFKVASKPAAASQLPTMRMGATGGAVGRPVPRAPPAAAGGARRIPANRAAVTRGRGPAANGRPAPVAARSNAPLPESVKRRRIDGPDGFAADPLPLSSERSAFAKPAEAARDSSNKDEDDDDDEEDDCEVGPPPALKQRSENDVNGRLHDLEAVVAHMRLKNRTARKAKKLLSVELEQHGTKVTQLEYEKKLLEAKVEDAEKQMRSLKDDAGDAQLQLQTMRQRHEAEVDDVQRKHKRKVEELGDEQQKLRKTLAELQETLDTTQASLRAKRDECVRLEATVSRQASDQVALESSCRGLRAKVEQLEDTLSEREIRIAELDEDVAARSLTVQELEAKLRKEETMRRSLHNTIQELKGNIRVFCRVRPLLGDSADGESALPIRLPECEDNDQIELSQTAENALGKTTSKSFPFKFDRVFGSDSTQDAVFEEVSQLIQSALDGYPVCIFAYGQTGSGKTHTMQGPDAISAKDMDAAVLGIIPRAVKQIYDNTSKLAERGWEYTLEGQFLEIYNETIQDLLAARGAQGGDKQAKLDIYQDSEGHTRVKNMTTVTVDSPERVHWLLARAADNRTVAATNCNERSSRSHSVFTLYLRGRNALTGESSSGVLNLIDLAGSERLSSSGSSGDRLKETQAINKSLACLGDVIAALAKGSRHIPYRNSKLTHLLQESLGAGNSKTLMFVCVSPSPASAQESLCSLQFATKVNSCQIGTAKRQAAS